MAYCLQFETQPFPQTQSLPGGVLSPAVRSCAHMLSVQIKPHTQRSSADQRQQTHTPFRRQNPCEAACHDAKRSLLEEEDGIYRVKRDK